MEIVRNLTEEMTLEEFADKHGLRMEVNERGHERGSPSNFYAHFEDFALQSECGYFLIGTYGNGATEEEAIANFAKEITRRVIVIDSHGESRREICVPRLIDKDGNEVPQSERR